MDKIKRCDICHKETSQLGYLDPDGKGGKFCYDCCGDIDRKAILDLKPGERTMYYFTRDEEDGEWHVSNWPGTFKVRAYYWKEGRHNFARKRIDFWFLLEGQHYHGVKYGTNDDLCYIQRLKK